jgi:hypothetical protein
MRTLRPGLPVFFASAALALAPWTAWLASSLPCRYFSQHWNVAWAGFDTALAVTLALTGVAALRRAAWLDRAAISAATLLVADAWFDVVTSHGATALATAEAVAVELPVALLCIRVATRDRRGLATTHKGAQS